MPFSPSYTALDRQSFRIFLMGTSAKEEFLQLKRLSQIVAVGWALWWSAVNLASAAPIQVHVIEQDPYKIIQVKTDLMNYQFSTRTGALESAYIHFKTFDTFHAELLPDVNTDPQTFFATATQEAVFPFQLNYDTPEAPPYEVTWEETAQEHLELRFTRTVGGLQVTKGYVIFNDPYYRSQFKLTLTNLGDAPTAQGYTMTFAPGLSQVQQANEAYLFDQKRHETALGPSQYGSFGGLGFLGQGLALFLKNETPPAPSDQRIIPWFHIDGQGRKVMGVQVESALNPGERLEHSFLLYAGRWKYVLMEQSGLGEVAGAGTFSQFLIPMIRFLDWLYAQLGNYGWAIIIFTLLTRVILFPMLRQQFHSMAKMRAVQPKMMRLRERYPGLAELRKTHKDMDLGEMQSRARENREKLNKKTMELYQREGVNPLSGCLPSLLQIPILIILWRTILYSAESIHFSPGFLWMGDLSQPDPYFILVGLTAVAMVLQTKLTPQAAATGQNQMLMWLFPLMMAFFLKDFPSGLWLYYFLTTVIQVLQQVIINWEIAQKKPAPVAVEQEPEDEAA